jgi:hypothetical protein
MQIITIGLDLAKHWFQVRGVDANGRVVVRRRLWRSGVIAYFRSIEPCLVGMEACARGCRKPIGGAPRCRYVIVLSGVGAMISTTPAPPAHVALLTPEALRRLRLPATAKVLDLKGRLRCRGCGRRGRAGVSIKWRGQGGYPAVSEAGPALQRHNPGLSGKERRRVGRSSRRRSPLGFAQPGRDRQASRSYSPGSTKCPSRVTGQTRFLLRLP